MRSVDLCVCIQMVNGQRRIKMTTSNKTLEQKENVLRFCNLPEQQNSHSLTLLQLIFRIDCEFVVRKTMKNDVREAESTKIEWKMQIAYPFFSRSHLQLTNDISTFSLSFRSRGQNRFKFSSIFLREREKDHFH